MTAWRHVSLFWRNHVFVLDFQFNTVCVSNAAVSPPIVTQSSCQSFCHAPPFHDIRCKTSNHHVFLIFLHITPPQRCWLFFKLQHDSSLSYFHHRCVLHQRYCSSTSTIKEIKSPNRTKDFLTNLSFLTGVHPGSEQVHQTPSDLFTKPKTDVTLSLSHTIPNYDTILWYQRSAGDTSLELVAYMYFETPKVEPHFETQFNVSGNGKNTAHLHILNPADSRQYFGAAFIHSNKDSEAPVQKLSSNPADKNIQTTQTTRMSVKFIFSSILHKYTMKIKDDLRLLTFNSKVHVRRNQQQQTRKLWIIWSVHVLFGVMEDEFGLSSLSKRLNVRQLYIYDCQKTVS